MKHLTEKLLPALLVFTVAATSVSGIAAPVKKAAPHAPAKVPAVTAAPAALTNEAALTVTPIDLLKDPNQYLNKKVAFQGTFNSFSTLGLDYKKAMRDSKDYISFLILRPDVAHHTIPLSEMKLIYPRKKSEDVMHLEPGDKISIKGQVFSTALSEPWLDVTEIKVLSKAKEKDKKSGASDCC